MNVQKAQTLVFRPMTVMFNINEAALCGSHTQTLAHSSYSDLSNDCVRCMVMSSPIVFIHSSVAPIHNHLNDAQQTGCSKRTFPRAALSDAGEEKIQTR